MSSVGSLRDKKMLTEILKIVIARSAAAGREFIIEIIIVARWTPPAWSIVISLIVIARQRRMPIVR